MTVARNPYVGARSASPVALIDPSTGDPLSPVGAATICDLSITRPTDTNAYANNDVWANSTSAPTTGGFTFSNAARVSGGAGLITDLVVINSVAAVLQGELWLFDSAVTAVNDNAAFALSDTDVLKLIGVIPFQTEAQPSNAVAHVADINALFVAVGSANLRALVKLKSAYTPGNAEVLTFRLKVRQLN